MISHPVTIPYLFPQKKFHDVYKIKKKGASVVGATQAKIDAANKARENYELSKNVEENTRSIAMNRREKLAQWLAEPYPEPPKYDLPADYVRVILLLFQHLRDPNSIPFANPNPNSIHVHVYIDARQPIQRHIHCGYY